MSLTWRWVKHDYIDEGSGLRRQHANFLFNAYFKSDTWQIVMTVSVLGLSRLSPQVHCPLSTRPIPLNSLGLRQVKPSNRSRGTLLGSSWHMRNLNHWAMTDSAVKKWAQATFNTHPCADGAYVVEMWAVNNPTGSLGALVLNKTGAVRKLVTNITCSLPSTLPHNQTKAL